MNPPNLTAFRLPGTDALDGPGAPDGHRLGGADGRGGGSIRQVLARCLPGLIGRYGPACWFPYEAEDAYLASLPGHSLPNHS
jgi:hypothetical protein